MGNYLNLKDSQLDKYIYRIISIDRLVELFENSQNVLVHPSLWDDPYENFILKSKVQESSGELVEYNFHKDFYGQCWTLHKASDAMWRIYSPNEKGVRIRTTIRDLLTSLYAYQTDLVAASSYIGRVKYLSKTQLTEFANNIFDDGSVANDNLFNSLLVKRLAFKHENEVRLLYLDIKESENGKIYSYSVNPHQLISQFMLDPRLTKDEAKELKAKLREATNFKGEIKRSLLYAPPKHKIIEVRSA
jgi:hypothetical protein